MKLDELDAWLQAQSADPAQAAKMEALMQQRPELRSEAIANLQAMERDSVRLLDQPDTAFLHLSPTEAGPWPKTLNEHLQKELEQLPDEPDATLSPAANSQMMETVLLPLLREMARAVFTPRASSNWSVSSGNTATSNSPPATRPWPLAPWAPSPPWNGRTNPIEIISSSPCALPR